MIRYTVTLTCLLEMHMAGSIFVSHNRTIRYHVTYRQDYEKILHDVDPRAVGVAPEGYPHCQTDALAWVSLSVSWVCLRRIAAFGHSQ
jgi:hypothetical protein